MEIFDAMRTMGSVREFDNRPIDHATLTTIFEHARFAGSGGNRQGWHVISVESPDVRREIRRISELGFREYYAQVIAGKVPFAPSEDGTWHGAPVDLTEARNAEVGFAFGDAIESAAALLLVTVDLRTLAITDIDANHASIIGGASIYPFVHNILLSARNLGIGGVLTTFVCRDEPALRTLLALPESHAVAAVLVLGYPKTQVTKLSRKPVEAFVTIDRFDGDPWSS